MPGDNRMKKYVWMMVWLGSLVYGAVTYKIPSDRFEDTYLLCALDAQTRQKYELASEYYQMLFDKTGKKEYLYQSLRGYEKANQIEKLSKITNKYAAKYPDDVMLERFVIISLLKEGNFLVASQKGQKLSEQTKGMGDYLLYADARIKLADYRGGVDALKKAYALGYDEETAERISLIMYGYLNAKKEAIAFLEEHMSAHGQSKNIGKRLGSLYADSGAYDKAAQMYEQTYAHTKDPAIALEAVKVYLYQQDLLRLGKLLEASGVNDEMLLELYIRDKKFGEASVLAKKLYEKENDPKFLAQSSIFAYEASTNRQDPVFLNEVIKGLQLSVQTLEDPFHLNYLGYLMIEHDIQVSEGMAYIKRALAKQPESPYYLDSLAWGHYKLGECAEAMRLINQVKSMIGTEEQEVRDHLKAIEKCKSKEK